MSVAGGATIEFSLQRIFTSLFLGLYNCEITGQLTIGHAFNKGEVLLAPSKLRLVSELGENLLRSIEADCCIKSAINECEDKLVCPHCLSDAFQIYQDGRLICPVCGGELKRTNENDAIVGFNRFSVQGACEHNTHIVNNVIGGMLARDEISQRLQTYWKSDILSKEDYQIDIDLTGIKDSLDWDNEELDALKATIPAAFEEIIKKVITKKALQNGETRITKETAWRYLPKF